MDLSKIKFADAEAKSKKSCKGCAFEFERSTVCHDVAAAAKERGIADCEVLRENGKGTIYVIVPVDDRQQTIFAD